MNFDRYAPKAEIYGSQTLYREWGYYLAVRELYDKALHNFDEAVSKTPEDKRALLGRSYVRSKLCSYEGAAEDVVKALQVNPTDLRVLAQKALNTFLDCEFEVALIQNVRLEPKRKKPDDFVMGVMHCTDTIETCLGDRAGRPLRDHFKIIRRLAWKKNFESQKPFEPKSKFKNQRKKKKTVGNADDKKFDPVVPNINLNAKTTDSGEEGVETIRNSLHSYNEKEDVIPPYTKHFPYAPLQHFTSNIENYMAEKYLDAMYLDKIFLKKLSTAPGLICPNKKGTELLKNYAKTGYKNVAYKQELLRARRPFYFIKFQEMRKCSSVLLKRQKDELQILQVAAQSEANVVLNKMLHAVANKNLRLVLKHADDLKKFCERKSKKILPNKQYYLDYILKAVCQAHFNMKRLNRTQTEEHQERRIVVFYGIDPGGPNIRDSVIPQLKDVFIDYRKQIGIAEENLKKSTTSEEMAWLYHELARYHLAMKEFELSRVYARKCIQEARECNNIKWMINAHILISKVYIEQRNKNDARAECVTAYDLAKEIGEVEAAYYIAKCINVIDKIVFDDTEGAKIIRKREQKIIGMMTGRKMKDEASHLFRMMDAMPPNRRMSVLPGIRIEPTPRDLKKRPGARKPSILPNTNKEDEEAATPKIVKDKRRAERASVGAEFLDMIQFHV